MSYPDKTARIAVFDSGLGGLTVVKEIQRQLPRENILYFGDTARVPYGNKSAPTIRQYAREIANELLQRDIKLLVIACNTASAWALEELQSNLSIPVMGVINPGVKAALQVSQNAKIAILGTKGTIRSKRYQEQLLQARPDAKILGIPCPLFVALVEEHWLEHPVTEQVIQHYLIDIHKEDIDTVLLACTHYPLLMPAIRRSLGPDVQLVDSASACAAQLRLLLEKEDLATDQEDRGSLEVMVSDDADSFSQAAQAYLGRQIRVELAVLCTDPAPQ